MSPRITAAQRAAVDHGWTAAAVGQRELVDDAWIAANTIPGKPPSTVRHLGGRVLSAARTIGTDPLAGLEADAATEYTGISRKLPRMARKYGVQTGGFTRDQMRRIAAATGYPYVEAWSSRNLGVMKGVKGALIHHTGTAASAVGDYPTLKVVRDGRADLQNSLCMFGLGRSGTIYLISEKLSWHAGAGNINGVTDGNGWLGGIEAESDGKTWTAAQVDAYPRLVAAILDAIGLDDKYTTRHMTYALPAGRKTDASGLDMDAFWADVYGYLANPAAINKNWTPALPSFPVIGRIAEAYTRAGAAVLGKPLGPEVPTTDPKGRWQEFERGRIYWHPAVDGGTAHALVGEIGKRFVALGAEAHCGWPVTDELTCPDGKGRYNHFTAGSSIYWSPASPARFVKGLVRVAWAAAGWETGLGYPVDEEHPAEGGIVQTFTRGSVLVKDGAATVRKSA